MSYWSQSHHKGNMRCGVPVLLTAVVVLSMYPIACAGARSDAPSASAQSQTEGEQVAEGEVFVTKEGVSLFPYRGQVNLLASHERVPPVPIHYVFTEPVELVRVFEIDDQGQPLETAPTLEVLARTYVRDERVQLEKGELVVAGDTITGGVIQNSGENTVALVFADGSSRPVEPGLSMFIGPIRVLKITHCPECHCKCSALGSPTCQISVAVPEDGSCGGVNNQNCQCKHDDPWGKTSECVKVYVPCARVEPSVE